MVSLPNTLIKRSDIDKKACLNVESVPAVVVETSRSPHARLKPVPVESVKLEDGFWAPRLDTLLNVTIPTQYQLLEETGRIDNFRRAAGKVKGPFRGLFFNDSDVYKWVEAASFALAYRCDPRVEELTDRVVAEIAAAQGEDGYLNTYFTFERRPATCSRPLSLGGGPSARRTSSGSPSASPTTSTMSSARAAARASTGTLRSRWR
jgi:hypothetical protein